MCVIKLNETNRKRTQVAVNHEAGANQRLPGRLCSGRDPEVPHPCLHPAEYCNLPYSPAHPAQELPLGGTTDAGQFRMFLLLAGYLLKTSGSCWRGELFQPSFKKAKRD